MEAKVLSAALSAAIRVTVSTSLLGLHVAPHVLALGQHLGHTAELSDTRDALSHPLPDWGLA